MPRGGYRPGAGRKPGSGRKDDSEARYIRIMMRCTEGENAAIESAAEQAGSKIGPFVRQVVLNHILEVTNVR